MGKPRNGCDYLQISLVNAGGGMWLAAEGHHETLRVNQVGRISLSWMGRADGDASRASPPPKIYSKFGAKPSTFGDALVECVMLVADSFRYRRKVDHEPTFYVVAVQ